MAAEESITRARLPTSARLRTGGVAAWSVRHPVGVVMIALAVVVLGLFSAGRLGVDLLPEIIYPEIGIRVIDGGVPANVMEDQVTRQVEEQLAITEDAISVQSSTSEGRSSIELSFGYGKDIDVALRDASTRLDRARRVLPDSVDPPVIFKRDPSQIPVLEFVVSSPLREPVDLRTWMDYDFARWFLNLPGVAAAEVGGPPGREILVLLDQHRLAGFGLTMDQVADALGRANRDTAGGRLRMARQELTGRTDGRFATVEAIAGLPLEVTDADGTSRVIRLHDVAEVVDSAQDERLRIRLDGVPGVQLAIQKQPQANTVAVADAVRGRLEWLRTHGILPEDVDVEVVTDGSVFVRQALRNAGLAAVSGALLAMLVVYLFLGDVRRTLIIGTGIPLGIMVAAIVMDVSGLTLNIMTLGGLALGVGMLVDNTIVMLENIARNQALGKPSREAATDAAAEVNSAVVAATSTNLAAVLPFLFIGGLVGLLFRELIATISAAIIASLVVALTVVPALGAKVPHREARGGLRRGIDRLMVGLQAGYGWLLRALLRGRWLVPPIFLVGLWLSLSAFQSGREIFLPEVDDGHVRAFLVADAGISMDEMDDVVRRIEGLLEDDPLVDTVYAQVGGFVFGRSVFESPNRSRVTIQLRPLAERDWSTRDWIADFERRFRALELAGVRLQLRPVGIRGIRLGRGDDDLSIRVQGPSLGELTRIGEDMVRLLAGTPGVANLSHSYEDLVQELTVRLDRERAATLGLDVEAVGRAVRIALQGLVVTDYIDGDRRFDVRIRLPREEMASPRDVEQILLFPGDRSRPPVYLGDVAAVDLVNAPTTIRRDQQQRMVEVTGSVGGDATLGEAMAAVRDRLSDYELPAGYTRYDSGAAAALREGEQLTRVLLGLALFLVLVVMAVQYESLRNPIVILLCVPFAVIGVAIGILVLDMPLSMPMWLGMIMLAGIVVNNAIVLVEYVELERERGRPMEEAIVEAGRLRLRPILMTTMTTVAGMLPLALALGEGAEMLQPLAVTIVSGLSFSMLVSLILVPVVYRLLGRRDPAPRPA